MDYQQLITFIMEMVGTIAFAASGAMVAVDRAMDIFGVIVLGVTTAVGGGAVRDVILRQCSSIRFIRSSQRSHPVLFL